ncbi:MAG: hypoxanthine phosphoribosyltransferase [Peptoclostridium sp.]|uniref:hypoxanthine phosphoribosyltransferase n=1 Tax=Peptoclostridium sp. TaxID=1904860 RepID=UPI00139EDCA9|nr:hypoxanthine phosphoribosyltransferase [Peptoclostridium sp.]MZQ76113.1 hypoxanthine phosphoribosyltransferase [Peptoclostridium sp.]
MHTINETLITTQQLDEKVAELAGMIERDFEGEHILLIGVLKGACIFVSDLMRKINLDVSLDFMSVSSYGNSTKSSGVVKILKDLDMEIENKNVIIVEDIIDTGLTLKYLTENLMSRKPKTLKICTLLDKPERRKCHLDVDYIGFTIPDKFIVGYGIDYAELYRNLPYIGVVNKD